MAHGRTATVRAVAETGSFTGAAQRLRVSQSAISRQLKLLEEELGALLLQRTGRGVNVTPRGTSVPVLKEEMLVVTPKHHVLTRTASPTGAASRAIR